MSRYPERIACLTEETTETLYLLEEHWRIVGISGFTVRPPRARKEKPKVSAFTSAKIGKILELEPDLVLAFSDLQADIAAELVRAGVNVHVFNHRSVDEILQMIRMLGGMIGCEGKAQALADELEKGLDDIRESAAKLPRRPKDYFEEWDEPMISGIRWVSELVEIAGGDDICKERSTESLAKNRIHENGDEVIAAQPDIIFGSWCGKKFRPEKVKARDGFDVIPAVQNDDLYEIKSPIILQPGPAALTEGIQEIHKHIRAWARAKS